MRKFTDIEIDLCKLIAEKERRYISKGDYYIYNNKLKLYNPPNSNLNDVVNMNIDFIPLWQEHDCLEFLVGKNIDIFIEWTQDHWWVGIAEKDQLPHMSTLELSLLEALLRAILEILDNETISK